MRLIVLAMATVIGCMSVADAKDTKQDDIYCGMLPPSVTSSLAYSGWSACEMRKADQKPIWNGLPPGTKQVTRFIFTQGHGLFYRAITITELEDGTNQLKVSGTRNPRGRAGDEQKIRSIRRKLSPDIVSEINALADKAGAFEFEAGTWDNETGEEGEEGEEVGIYLHCQLLEMERANPQGYRFSSVNIGCNQPEKLMPLVREIVRQAKMKNTHNGMLFE